MRNKVIQILLVEDDLDDKMFFEEALRELTADVKLNHALNGIEAIEVLKNHKAYVPNIIFLDVNMPLLAGGDCLKTIKNMDWLEQSVIIMYSTTFDIKSAKRYHQLGANHFICKPSNFNHLKKLLLEVLAIVVKETSKPVIWADFLIPPINTQYER